MLLYYNGDTVLFPKPGPLTLLTARFNLVFGSLSCSVRRAIRLVALFAIRLAAWFAAFFTVLFAALPAVWFKTFVAVLFAIRLMVFRIGCG